MQVDLKCFAQLVATVRVWYALYDTSKHPIIASSIADAFVRNDVKV